MKKVVVTGCAGFIGSALSRRLLMDGYQVLGVDCFTDNYDIGIKQRNIDDFIEHPNFRLYEQDLLDLDCKRLLEDVSYVFHQAAIPGVRTSWGGNFGNYVRNNIVVTQTLLEAAKGSHSLEKFVYASSSSIYGKTDGNTSETVYPRPFSPYGVSKLGGEQLCHLYADNFQVPTVSLRYFTVYGPGQRPDMAFHKFILALIRNEPIPVYGNGNQSRDFTFIDDAVEANLLAARSYRSGVAYNIGGKSKTVLNDVISLMEELTRKKARISFLEKQKGDPPHTWADIRKAEAELGYSPKIELEEGLRRQIEDLKERYA